MFSPVVISNRSEGISTLYMGLGRGGGGFGRAVDGACGSGALPVEAGLFPACRIPALCQGDAVSVYDNT